MSKTLKGLIRDELSSTLKDLDGGVFITYAGLDSQATFKLRSTFHSEGVKMRVLPNRIAKRAFGQLGFEAEAIGSILVGETAVIYAESPIAAARAVRQRISEGMAIKVKGAFLETEVLDATTAATMADLPTHEELLGQISFCFNAGAQRIAGCFQQTYKQIAGCFLSYSEELEEGGGAAA